MDKLQAIIKHCKASVYLAFNDHRTNHLSVEEELSDFGNYYNAMSAEHKQECIDKDAIVAIQAYPDTPNGCVKAIRATLEDAIDDTYIALGLGDNT